MKWKVTIREILFGIILNIAVVTLLAIFDFSGLTKVIIVIITLVVDVVSLLALAGAIRF